jgi:predicted MPP superfamily phosphohydrolase
MFDKQGHPLIVGDVFRLGRMEYRVLEIKDANVMDSLLTVDPYRVFAIYFLHSRKFLSRSPSRGMIRKIANKNKKMKFKIVRLIFAEYA